ncbi:hypothetical protein K4X33_10795 [Brevibacterium casei]|nr:hypothetical protein K4X33_10795 [Brevibacterium casei]
MTADLAQTTEAKSSTWFESLAVFVAMVLTAIGLSAVFSDLGWLPPVLVAVALIVAVGAIFRSIAGLRATGTAVIAQCVVGVFAVLILCVPDTMLFGVIPTGDSFVAVIDLLSSGVSDLYASTPPAASTPASPRCSRSPSHSSRSSSTASSPTCARPRSPVCSCSCCG